MAPAIRCTAPLHTQPLTLTSRIDAAINFMVGALYTANCGTKAGMPISGCRGRQSRSRNKLAPCTRHAASCCPSSSREPRRRILFATDSYPRHKALKT
jgi:hypothetical protein